MIFFGLRLAIAGDMCYTEITKAHRKCAPILKESDYAKA